ncbi:MAG TPA: Alanine racemase [Hyphomicrobiaceae bacterium MAG_BT-2024]
MDESSYQPASLLKAPVHARSVIEVDIAAICRNWRKLNSMTAASVCGAVVKADAYGLGLNAVVTALVLEGCKTFFVATLEEGRHTRSVAPNAEIYILDGLLPGTELYYLQHNLIPVLSSTPEITDWAIFSRSAQHQLYAAIHIDTGMRRLGISRCEFLNIVAMIKEEALTAFNVTLIMSHLACSDNPNHSYNKIQLFQFARLRQQFPEARYSLANSGGIFLGPDFHFDTVRPGIALYGGHKFSSNFTTMEMVVRFYGRILQLQFAEAGETVGYGAVRILKRRTKIATIALGYADGFMRLLGSDYEENAIHGFIGDIPVPIIGPISMDLITLDVTDVPERLVFRGSWVELIGEWMTLDDLASHANTIGYEILTRLGNRAHRIYLSERI